MKASSLNCFLSAVAVILVGCAGQQIKPAEIAKVRRVAVIGFDVLQQKSVSGGDLLGLALKGKGAGAAQIKLAAVSAHVDPMIADLESRLKREKGWNVLASTELRKSSRYQALLKAKTEGFQNRPAVADRYDPFRAGEVLDSWAILSTPAEELRELARELKVDALIVGTATVHLNNSGLFSSLVGDGEYKPKADLTLFVIQGSSGDKIFTKTLEGPAVEKGERNVVGMADDAKLNRLAQVATGLSVGLMLKEIPSRRE